MGKLDVVQVNRRHFIGGMMAAGVAPVLAAGDARIARVGLMTDTHIGNTMESCSRVRAALELFKAHGAEMVVNCGDIADRHYPDGYRCYRKIVNEVYPDQASRPIERFVYAYHDVGGFGPEGGRIASKAAAAYAEVHRLLEAPNTHTDSLEWKGMVFLNFPQATGTKDFLSWDEYEAAVRRACETHPGKPVFVLDHLPPAGTTYHSRHWGSRDSRRVLNKFPQVVSISGHVHGSLASERQIWQGEFTAVNVGCLQSWGGFAPGSTPPPQAKQNFGVLLMDIYLDRLVFSRLDVRDGSSFGPPWVVPLPFASRLAPYRPEIAAACTRRAEFAQDASVKVAPASAGYTVEFPAAVSGTTAFMYRIEAMRKDAAGAWTPFSRDDIFSEFWKRPKDRTGCISYNLDAGFFTPGESYRLRVTPLDWFYRGSRAIECAFTASVPSGRIVWQSENAMSEMRFTEAGKPVEVSTGGRYVPSTGQGVLRLPDHALKELVPGARARCMLEIDTVQPDGDWCAWRVTMCARGGLRLADVQTAPGAPGPLRYVFTFKVPSGGMDSAEFHFNYESPGSSIRVLSAFVS